MATPQRKGEERVAQRNVKYINAREARAGLATALPTVSTSRARARAVRVFSCMNFRVPVRYAGGVNSIFACTALERAPIAQSNSGRTRNRRPRRRRPRARASVITRA